MPDVWLTALISGAAAVLGGGVVALSNYWLRKLDIAQAERGELRVALASFLHVLELIGLEAQRQLVSAEPRGS